MSNFTAYRYYSTNSSATSVSLLTIPSGLDDYNDVSNQVSYTISAYERIQMEQDIDCMIPLVNRNRNVEQQSCMLSKLVNH